MKYILQDSEGCRLVNWLQESSLQNNFLRRNCQERSEVLLGFESWCADCSLSMYSFWIVDCRFWDIHDTIFCWLHTRIHKALQKTLVISNVPEPYHLKKNQLPSKLLCSTFFLLFIYSHWWVCWCNGSTNNNLDEVQELKSIKFEFGPLPMHNALQRCH